MGEICIVRNPSRCPTTTEFDLSISDVTGYLVYRQQNLLDSCVYTPINVEQAVCALFKISIAIPKLNYQYTSISGLCSISFQSALIKINNFNHKIR